MDRKLTGRRVGLHACEQGLMRFERLQFLGVECEVKETNIMCVAHVCVRKERDGVGFTLKIMAMRGL